MTDQTLTPTEYRLLGRLMRHARAEGYTYYRTTFMGNTDWSWSKGGNYAVLAQPLAVGWKVTFDDGRAELWPASVQQLTDVLVALGLLPAIGFSSAWSDGEQVAYDAVYEQVKTQVAEWYDDLCAPVERGWPKVDKAGYLRGVAEAIDNVCDVIGVAHPEWDHMREVAEDAIADAKLAGAR